MMVRACGAWPVLALDGHACMLGLLWSFGFFAVDAANVGF
jgi:hypothetical protein